jgi:type IV pilus assembly protein PilM
MPSQQMPSLLKSNISLNSLKKAKLSDLKGAKLALPGGAPSFLAGNVSFKRRRVVTVGLDIQPGYVAAAKVHQNGRVVVESAAAVSLEADTVREGEVLDHEALVAALKEVFSHSDLPRHVRIGVANQRTVMRMLEVPPFSDQNDLAAAVRHQAEDQVPMPLSNAVLDYRALGIVDTPNGPRQRVLLVAAQRDMVDKLLGAVKAAGLHPEGIDLSAFALIRSLYVPGVGGDGSPDGAEPAPVLHLNVGGLTNMAIAEGADCRFTRVLARGLEAIAAEVAERRGVPIDQARELLRRVNLSAAPAVPLAVAPLARHLDVTSTGSQAQALSYEAPAVAVDAPATPQMASAPDAGLHTVASAMAEVEAEHGYGTTEAPQPAAAEHFGPPAVSDPPQPHPTPTAAPEPAAMSEPISQPASMVAAEPTAMPAYDFAAAVGSEPAVSPEPAPPIEPQAAVAAAHQVAQAIPATPVADDLPDVRSILEMGVRGIGSEVRNSLDFYQSQEQGSSVTRVLLSGPALDIPGFGEMLELNLGVPVHAESVAAVGASALNGISVQYLAIAAGLAIEDIA